MARWLARWLAFFLLIAGALAPQRALSEPQRATLTLTRDEGASACIDGTELGKQVDLLAGTPVIVDGAGIAVAVTIRPAKQGFVAHIVLSGERTGERTLDEEGPGCDVLSRALVVTVAILLDAGPGAPIEPPRPPQPPPPRKLPPKRIYYDLPAVPRPEPPPQRPAKTSFFSASVAAIYDFGTLVDDAGGFTLGGDVLISYLAIGAAMVVLPLDRLELSTRDIEYSFVGGRAQLCSKPPFAEPFGFSVCSGFVAGQRNGSLSDTNQRSSSGAFVVFESRLELSRRLDGPVGVFASAGVGGPLLAEPVDVYVPRRARPVSLPEGSATFQSGLGIRFWLDL